MDQHHRLKDVLEIPSEMKEERYAARLKNLIRKFYNHYKDLIENCPKQLLFGAHSQPSCLDAKRKFYTGINMRTKMHKNFEQ